MFIYNDNSWFHLTLWSFPLRSWWKAKKYFKFPKLQIQPFFALRISAMTETMYKIGIKPNIKLFGKEYLISHSCSAPYANNKLIGKIIDISCSDVMWKDKYNTPRHERDPYFYISFFRLFGVWITFGKKYIDPDCNLKNASMEYWEYMLDYLHYSKSLIITDFWEYNSNVYKNRNYENGETKPIRLIVPTPSFSLNKRGRKEFVKIHNKLKF